MATRLREGVWWVDLRGVNAYLVRDEDGITLVDTGMPWHGRQIDRAFDTLADAPADLTRVLLTHFDFDHVGGLDTLLDRDVEVFIGVDDEPFLAGRDKPTWSNMKGAFQRVTTALAAGPKGTLNPVDEGYTVGKFSAYHTPGHTPGHTVFVHDDHSTAFLGDLVREADGRFERPPWFLNADHTQAGESIVRFADRAPEFDVACPGHGRPITEDSHTTLADFADELRVKSDVA